MRNRKKYLVFLCTIFLICTNCITSLAKENQQVNADEYFVYVQETGVSERISFDQMHELVGESISEEQLRSAVPVGSTIWWVFTPTNINWYYESPRRVSPTFSETAVSMSVSITITRARSVTQTGGVTFSGTIWNAIDAKVESAYSVARSASSSTSASVTGTFVPKAGYEYNWITFAPRMATITGNLTMKISFNGSQLPDGPTYSGVVVKYPAKVGSFLDGHYAQGYTNNPNNIPNT